MLPFDKLLICCLKILIDLKNEIQRRKLEKATEEKMKTTANKMFIGGKYRGWWAVTFEHDEVKNDY